MKRIKKHLNKSNLDFNRSILKKQFRFSDWFAEKVIRSVAFLSIAFVILIFLFVFRETLPIFKKSNESTVQIFSTDGKPTNNIELKPESYSSGDENDVSTGLKPENYSSITDSQIVLKPESYGDLSLDVNSLASEESTINKYLPGVEKSENALSTLTSKDWQPISDNPRYGLLPLIIGTMKVSLIAILFAISMPSSSALVETTHRTSPFLNPRSISRRRPGRYPPRYPRMTSVAPGGPANASFM